ncbi:MAG: hypothetical protein J1E42_05810 [Akkermansiaceae bacterium]|nr:hypothetical protein [Akkermansiaceae bacterium]
MMNGVRTVWGAALAALAAAGGLRAQQVAPELPTAREAEENLPPEELHIRAGIILLAKVYNCLSRVEDHESAQAAVPVLVRLTHELQAWGRGVATLPPLSAEMKVTYEARYMAAIRRLNDNLRVQGERLAVSEYFGSQDLSAALVSLFLSVQQ